MTSLNISFLLLALCVIFLYYICSLIEKRLRRIEDHLYRLKKLAVTDIEFILDPKEREKYYK